MFDFTRRFDFPILDWIAEHLWCPFLDAVMPGITHLGDGGILWIALALLLLCLPKWRKTGLTMGIALLMGLLLCNLWLKPWIGRLRPFDYQLQCYGTVIPLLIEAPTDASFPSGHTVSAMAVAFTVYLQHKKLGIVTIICGLLMGLSRLYVGVHFPTDVYGGILVGLVIALAVYFAEKKVTPILVKKFKK